MITALLPAHVTPDGLLSRLHDPRCRARNAAVGAAACDGRMQRVFIPCWGVLQQFVIPCRPPEQAPFVKPYRRVL